MELNFDIAEDELQIFLAEANEHLQILDEGLVRLEREGDDPPLLQALFRAAHTLKGSAGAIGHQRMAELTHVMETVLDGLRKGTHTVDVRMADALLESLDALRLLLTEVVDRQRSPVDIAVLVARLTRFAQAAPSLAAPAPVVVPALAPVAVSPVAVGAAPPNGKNGKNGHTVVQLPPAPKRARSGKKTTARAKSGRAAKTTRKAGPGAKAAKPARRRSAPPAAPAPAAPLSVRVDFTPGCFASAARAFQAMLALQELGEIVSMQPDQAAIETSTPIPYFMAQVITAQPAEAIRQALAAIPDVARLTLDDLVIDLVAPPEPAPAPVGAPPTEQPSDESAQRVGEYLVSAGRLTAAQLQAAIDYQAAEREPRHLLGQTLVRMGFVPQEILDQAIAQQISQLRSALQASQAAPEKGRARAEQTVRTSVERLDSLMNLVGELITGRNRLYQLHRDFEQRWRSDERVDELGEAALNLGRLTDQLQEEVMRIRMLPIASAFNKFPRLVRDLARQTGKQVDLVLRGEDTELDRSVIEAISDPLIHMLRNAIDHGLETPDERRAAGKPERGTVLLTARHEEGRIILTVEDDGRGIDGDQVKASAVRKGLLTEAEAAALTPAQAVDLIFAPGLSTAKTVSGLSGRGVGMDIVRSNVERLNGNVTVETWPGRGTKFQVGLPLTLAIVPALLVQTSADVAGVAAPVFAIPLASVMEALHLTAGEIHTVNSRPVTLLRGSVLPLLRLSEALGFAPTDGGAASREYVVAVRWGKSTMGLRVDRLVGEQEVVIKSLGPLVGETVGVAGAAILGDGQIALIVDVPGLFKLAGA